MRRPTKSIPTTEEILGYDNVPVEVAARYIGWSSATLYRALQEERTPFGFAVEMEHWTYNISPGALVKYKAGELPAYRLQEVIHLAAHGVERILNTRMAAMDKALQFIGGKAG